MSELKQSIAQLLIDNFKGATSKKASDMAIAIMAFVNADREREIESAFCGTPGTGECSCRKFADNPLKCDNRRTQPEATKPAQDLSAAILARPPGGAVSELAAFQYWAECQDEPISPISAWNARAALASPADALVAGDDDPIGDLQAEARQEKLDDFIASMNPNPTSKNKVQAAGDVLAERERQKQQEGWTPERDDKYIDCELARAAATYSLCTDPEQIKVCGAPVWPWPIYWWKPTTYRRNLVKAGALILAEIERLDRAAIQAQKDGHG